MKILIVSQYYYPERFSVTDIAETLVKHGHNVTVLTGKPNYGYDKIIEEYEDIKYQELNGVKIHRVDLYPRKKSRISIIRNYLSFHNIAKRFVRKLNDKFDVVFAFSLSPVISVSPALLYAKKHNVPCVLFCQDLWPESTTITGAVKKNSLTYKLLYKWSKSIYTRCDRIIVSSPSFKEYFDTVLNIKDKVFNYVPQPIIKSKDRLEAVKYSNKHNLVYAGNIGSIQLIDNLVDAMELVKTPDVKLHLMGMGSELNCIKEKIVAKNLKDKVIYEGAFPIEKAETFYWNSDALIVSLKNDGFVGKTIPNKAVQYMTYGKPILCVASGDTKEMLGKANGAVFSGENASEIADAIDNICSLGEKEKEKLGSNNKKYYEMNFELDKIVYDLETELSEAIKLFINSPCTRSE